MFFYHCVHPPGFPQDRCSTSSALTQGFDLRRDKNPPGHVVLQLPQGAQSLQNPLPVENKTKRFPFFGKESKYFNKR